MDKLSYALGLGIGQQLKSMGTREDVNIDDFAQAIKDVLDEKPLAIQHTEAQQIVNAYFQKMESRMNAEKAEKGKKALEEGKQFLAENAKKEGVTTTASGLQYEVLSEGNGKRPAATDKVRCHYEGRLIDGTVFDSSYERGKPATFRCSQVIKGWTEALTRMSEGDVWELYIPYQLAYGERESGKIKPYSALIFKVELHKVIDSKTSGK